LEKFQEAREEFRNALSGDEQILGALHPETMEGRRHYAEILEKMGDFPGALVQYRALAEARARTLGADDPETLYARTAVANMLGWTNRRPEEEMEARAVFAVAERVLGAGHEIALISRRLVLESAFSQHKFKEAEAGYRQLLADDEKYLGPSSKETLAVRLGLAGTLMMGKSEDAVTEMRKIVDARTGSLGPEHADTLNSRTNLGFALLKIGKLAEAEKELRTVLALHERVLGREHPGTIYCCSTLSVCLAIARQQEEAVALAVRANESAKKVLQPGNSDLLYYAQLLKAVQSGEPPDLNNLGILRM
jgi:tetratricopeptide (TPR) repeat protein